jgi:hypothetical protein
MVATTALGCIVFRGLTTEHERVLLKLIAHLVGDEDIQGDPCA